MWLTAGLILGVVVTYALVRQMWVTNLAHLREEHRRNVRRLETEMEARWRSRLEAELARLRQAHARELVQVGRRSVQQSRAVLKGKVAEQMAPMLERFPYAPSDARFLGDPVDYIIFDGYSEAGRPLEVVLLEIKQGKGRLSQGQRRIARAVTAGRVRFETLHLYANGTARLERAERETNR